MFVLLSERFTSRASVVAGAALVAFGLIGCGSSSSPEPINPLVFETMHSKGVDSYALLPVVIRTGEGKLEPTGSFNLVTKVGELRNSNAVNPEGQSGELFCSTYLTTRAQLGQTGEIVTQYSTGARHSSLIDYRIAPQANKVKLPEIHEGGRLYHSKHNQYCTFAPAVPAMGK